MTNNSTEPQASATAQNSSEAAAKIVDSLTKAIKELPTGAQFCAFLLVVALIATVIATLAIDSNDHKLFLLLVFFAVLLFVFVLYALSTRQTRVENNLTNLKKATNELQNAADNLQTETNKRINKLELIRSQLQEIESEFKKLPHSNETKFIEGKIFNLIKNVSEDLEAIDSYRRKLAVANEIASRTQSDNGYELIVKEFFSSQPKQTEEK